MNARLAATITLLSVVLMVLSIACENTPASLDLTPTNLAPTPTNLAPTPANATSPAPGTPRDGAKDEDGLELAQAELDKHRALWEASRAQDYSFVLTPVCFCPQNLLDPVRISVVDGIVASVTYVESDKAPEHDGFGRYVTIDDLFDTIQEGIDQEAAEVTVSYDPIIGYPADASIDYDARMADEEYRFAVSGYLPGKG